MAKKTGRLIWITGLPGAGKTTLAAQLYRLVSKKEPAVLMDGDHFRKIMGHDLGYSHEDRKKNAFRLCRMNKFLVDHDLIVICATVSLYREVHEWNRKNIKNYTEVLIESPKHLLHKRKKSLYSQAKDGKITNLIGVHQEYELPTNPHVVIVNTGSRADFIKNAKKIASL